MKLKIFKGHNLYQILIYFLITKEKERYFLFDDHFNKNFIEKIKKRYLIQNIKIYRTKSNVLKNFYYFLKRNFNFLKIRKELKMFEPFEIIGNEHEINFLLRNNDFSLIEDGLGTYKYIKEDNKEKYLLLKKLFFKVFMFEMPIINVFDENVKKIYLTGLAPIPEEIKDKVEIINLKKLWNKKTEEEKEEILDIFGFNNSIIERLKNKKEVLYTQPLSEDAVITEEEKIEIYTKVIKNYKKETLVIKQHPREKTDYKKIFPDIEILNQSFPAELFNLLGIKFEKAITLFSTAALSNKNIEVDFYGTEVHPKILKRFGKMNNIMQTNTFIKEENNE